MPNVKLVNIKKVFGKDVVAVDGVNLEVQDGEYLTLLGPSGCGKTTTFRVIAGLEKQTEGQVFLDGVEISDVPPEDRGIGMVFQHFEIFPHLDVWDNVAYSLKIRIFPKRQIEEQVLKALKMVNMIDRAGAFPRDLSAPELQRVGIARAIATMSKLLLFDEPLGSLDQRYRDEFRIELRRIIKELGYTAIHVTHDQDEAMMISDRIAVMRQGKILQVGTPTELYTRPNSIFVANFIGESNFFNGMIIKKNETGVKIRMRAGGPVIQTSDNSRNIGESVVFSIRKEFVKLHPLGSNDPYTIEGEIQEISFLGSYLRVYITLKNLDSVEAKITYPPRFPIQVGDRVRIKFHPKNIMVYDYPKNLEYELALE
ncbi:MAG: ABC transporter ATP-binding protein [Candidatus Helarchaeota archaeon]